MSSQDPWRLVAGLALGLASTAPALAQDLPDPLPSPPMAAPARPAVSVVPEPPVQLLSASPVVIVPPEGVQPTWQPYPLDPIALERSSPGHVAHKARWWRWRRTQGKFWGYPEEFEPRPLGAALYDHGRTMTANGAAARLTLFDYDFVDGTSRLSARGRIQLAKLSAQLAAVPYPLIVEATPNNPSLANSRRYAVLAELAGGPCPVPSGRVLVGIPAATGISGIDAQIIGANMLTRTQGYGPPIPINSNGVNSPSGVTSGGASPNGLPGQ